MKTKYWVILLSALLAVCAGLSFFLLRPDTGAAYVEVWSDGKLKCTLALNMDQVIAVESRHGTNVVTVRDGKVAVTQADCPDRYCVARGFCGGGTEIVCLPNRLVLRFVGETGIDGAVG